MSQPPFSFVQTGSWRLECPLGGFGQVPSGWRELLLDAPYTAARRAVDASLFHHVDFLLLVGDILEPELAGPRGLIFLVEQFQRLETHGIAVYWAGGSIDPPSAWPDGLPLPANVRRFPLGKPAALLHERQDVPVARLIGASRQRRKPKLAEFAPEDAGLFSLAVLSGITTEEDLPTGCGYWALGGQTEASTGSLDTSMAHDAGSTQGRSPSEGSGQGCTLVQVDAQGRTRLRRIPTAAVRYRQERIVVESGATRTDVERQCSERARTLVESAEGTETLVEWRISGLGRQLLESGPVGNGLVGRSQATWTAELLESLNREFAERRSKSSAHRGSGDREDRDARAALWSLGLRVDRPPPDPSSERESLLGEFLERVVALGQDPPPAAWRTALELGRFVGPQVPAAIKRAISDLGESDRRQETLTEVAAVGQELFQPPEVRS